MSSGRFGAGIENAFGHAFVSEIEKVAAKKDRKKGWKKGGVKKAKKKRSRGDRLLRTLLGAGIGGVLGSGAVAAGHGVVHRKRTKLYRAFKPLAKAFGPDVARAYRKSLKPRYFRPALFSGAFKGGLMGAAPGALIAALT